MERVDKTDKSFQFFFGAGCGSKTIIYVAAKKFWFGTVELIENLFFHIANKSISVVWSHFGSHGYTVNLLKDFSGKCETVKCQDKFSQTKQCVG